MRTVLRAKVLLAILPLAACSAEQTGDDGGSGDTGGTMSTSGGTAGANTGGTPSGGTAAGGTSAGGNAATGGSAGVVTGGTAGTAGTTPIGGTSGASGSGAGGSGAGGSGVGGGGVGGSGTGGMGAMAGRAGSSGGGSGPTGGVGGAMGGTGGAPNPGKSGLPVPPGPGNVPKPAGTPGNVTVVNWAGFKGAVSYTFDDANSSQISNYSQLNALDVPFTFFLWTGKTEAMNSIWQTAKNDGHELANHTQSHSSNGTTQDIDAAQQFIQTRFGVTAWTLAAPNGAAVYTTLAQGRFFINRGVSNSIIAPNGNSDPFTLPTYIPPTGASASAFNTQVDQARDAGGWRTMCIHGFQGGSDGAYQPVPLAEFISSVNHAKQFGDMWLDTLTNVGAYWRGQKAFTAAMATTSGSDRTWTWTLPDDFPTGHYLRVTVAGGTLKQRGVALAWDPHGYYEIELDALSVTLSP